MTGVQGYGAGPEPLYDNGSKSASFAVNVSLARVHKATITGGTPTISFSNWPASGLAESVTLVLVNGGAGTVAWDTPVKWDGGTAPTPPASGTSILEFVSADGGTTVYGFEAGNDMS